MVTESIVGTPLPCTGSHNLPRVRDLHRMPRSEDRKYCQNSGGYCGVSTHGFFAEYARIDATQAAKLPDKASFETATQLACARCTVYYGVVLSGVKKGEWLAIVGSGGGLGHLGVQFAKSVGVERHRC
jgi:propanol-preferring alcohol dehydrogenase